MVLRRQRCSLFLVNSSGANWNGTTDADTRLLAEGTCSGILQLARSAAGATRTQRFRGGSVPALRGPASWPAAQSHENEHPIPGKTNGSERRLEPCLGWIIAEAGGGFGLELVLGPSLVGPGILVATLLPALGGAGPTGGRLRSRASALPAPLPALRSWDLRPCHRLKALHPEAAGRLGPALRTEKTS